MANTTPEQKRRASENTTRWFKRNKARLMADPEWLGNKKRINREHMARMRATDPDLLRERNRARRAFALCRKHGISIDQFHAMQERQDFSCAICERVINLHVDHCHHSGHVRGLLCINCNTGIGSLRESPELFRKAERYLEGWV